MKRRVWGIFVMVGKGLLHQIYPGTNLSPTVKRSLGKGELEKEESPGDKGP